jgi:hypothetical protein
MEFTLERARTPNLQSSVVSAGHRPIKGKELAYLTTSIVEDTEDTESFDRLTFKCPELAQLQSDYFRQVSVAIRNTKWLRNLSESGKERLSHMVLNAPVSDGSLALALDILEFSAINQKRSLELEDLVLSAFKLLRQGLNELDSKQLERLAQLAVDYGRNLEPCGRYQAADQISFEFEDQDQSQTDLVGAGAILCLCEVEAEKLKAALSSLDDGDGDLLSAALKFSREYPSKPNLFIHLLQVHQDAFTNELNQLKGYQQGGLLDKRERGLITRSIKEWALIGGALVHSALLGPINLDLATQIMLVLGSSAFAGVLAGGCRLLEILKMRKLSAAHHEHLKAGESITNSIITPR